MDIVMRLFQRWEPKPEPKKKRGPVSPHLERNALIVERISKGETLAGVGKDYGVSRQRIEQIVQKAGIKVGIRRSPTVDAMVRDYQGGESLDIIAARHGYPYALARAALQNRGIIVPPKPPHRKYLSTPHGTLYGYVYYGCRCDECVMGQRIARRQEHVNRLARADSLPPEKHGSASTYTNYGCRCQPCTKANTIANKPYQKAWAARQRAKKAIAMREVRE